MTLLDLDLDPDLLVDLTSWADLHRQVHLAGAEVVVSRVSDLRLTVLPRLRLGVRLELEEPVPRLRAQDRRRLHRLGLRAEQHVGWSTWWWHAPVPIPPGPSTDAGAVVLTRLATGLAVRSAVADKIVEVLRDGLRLPLTELAVLELPEEDPWDDDETW